jgi:hypothetical protein
MSEPEDDRFDSWKEIATHLKRDLRTVRRWETERGLPVHRVPGNGRRAVFAYRSEIDVWLRAANAEAADEPQPSTIGRAKLQPWVPMSAAVVIFVAASLVVFALRTHRNNEEQHVPSTDDRMPSPLIEPIVTSVTSILPQPEQSIVIKGRDLGRYAPFRKLDTPYLAIRDVSAHWAAGRIIDRNPDDVTLSVSSWTDSEIVVTGFAGAYGQGNWKLSPGDEIDVAVWNPQTGAGPAIYRVICGRSNAAR